MIITQIKEFNIKSAGRQSRLEHISEIKSRINTIDIMMVIAYFTQCILSIDTTKKVMIGVG